MEVRHGALVSVYGTPVRREGYTFMPADVVLEGSSFSLDFELRDYLGDEVPVVLRLAVRDGIEAAWVRARIPRLPLSEQRQYGEAFRRLTEVTNQIERVSALAADAVQTAVYGLTSGVLAPPRGGRDTPRSR